MITNTMKILILLKKYQTYIFFEYQKNKLQIYIINMLNLEMMMMKKINMKISIKIINYIILYSIRL